MAQKTGTNIIKIVEEKTVNMKRRVTIMKDTLVKFPELWLDIYVSSDETETRHFNELFSRARCRRADTPEKADIIVFGGGDDVNPKLYGETCHLRTRFNDQRDKFDIELYELAYSLGIPMVGVCRGAQFLSVMNGGKLYQDIDNHYGEHSVFDLTTKTLLKKVSSVHHQAVMSNCENGMEIIGVAHKSQNRWLSASLSETGSMKDIEAFFYRESCCLGVQGHPEYKGYHEYAAWFLGLIEKYIQYSPDLIQDTESRCVRIKPELLAERILLLKETA